MAHITPATKTMQAFEDAVARDQGSQFRQNLEKVIPTMEDAYRADDGGFRSHLGVSMLGEECHAKLFYNFRWATKPKFSGQTLRLFNRGHLEEARFVALLRAAGIQIWQQDNNGHQFRVSYRGGHLGSAIDGVVMGCPDFQDQNIAVLTEMKTHNDKSFQKLKKEGVQESKPEHYTQMQVYMRAYSLPAALYLAVNKNNDEIWAEIIYLHSEFADQEIDKGIQITTINTVPSRISNNSSWFKCKWCEHNDVCHKGKMPEVNCRTCRHSTTKDDGTWFCTLHNDTLTKEMQLAACAGYNPSEFYGKK